MAPTQPAPLAAYLLGELPFEAFLAFQRRLVYDAGEGTASVVVCDHPPGITVGREGSRRHVRVPPEGLSDRGWPVRWVARGGGVMLHLPGQVAVYPVLPLAALGLTPAGYVNLLSAAVADALASLDVPATTDTSPPGVFVGGRRIAHVGVSVRGGVTAFGAVVNVAPDLELFRGIDCDGSIVPMTSAARECPHPVRPAAVREALTAAVARRFGFGRVSVFHTHPALAAGHPTHAARTAARR